MQMLLLLLLLSAGAHAETTNTSVSTSTETDTWKRVDKSLNEGVRTAKKKFIDAADEDKKPKEKKPAEGLDKVTDSLNDAWDSALKGVGKVLKTQQISTSTSTSTATEK
ncbi:MAG: hypothetical protein ACXVB9_08160 [Bdellovibrionota bacterium]